MRRVVSLRWPPRVAAAPAVACPVQQLLSALAAGERDLTPEGELDRSSDAMASPPDANDLGEQRRRIENPATAASNCVDVVLGSSPALREHVGAITP
ncbi:hypothetical protein M2405_004017 [Rhodococcus erythropolis]|uniref:hypothetical protein n=1 Tax=Rhodococcus erythropolis TaxID=1833 RepID=UPI0021686683|nr:hypothetical protein [Rhodococcus erythropolis]MCS4255714.1 hypothetical protein [Rhodococcus erythropolis]MCW2425228.1 hypothetical protein [Rhodococcus erythropolis]